MNINNFDSIRGGFSCFRSRIILVLLKPLDRDLLDYFIDNFYEVNYPDIYQLEQNAFKDWFGVCWEKAGGRSLHLPSYFVFHDDYKSFDLKSNHWIDDEEKWT